MIVALGGLGWQFPPAVLVLISAVLAFAYIAISGVRAPAFISILKDVILVVAVVLVGVAAARVARRLRDLPGGEPAYLGRMSGPEQTFAMTTVFFQALGFYVVPFSVPFLFTARSEQTIRRTQILMPLYMLMYPFLVIAAYYSLAQALQLSSPNQAFMAAAVHLLPDWLLGIVAAGASLSGLIVLAGISLAIGPLVSRNILHGLSEPHKNRRPDRYRGVPPGIHRPYARDAGRPYADPHQHRVFRVRAVLPGRAPILFFRKANPYALLAGLVTGVVLAILLYELNVNLWGVNIGLVCLTVNALIAWLGSSLARSGTAYLPVAERREFEAKAAARALP